MNVSITTRQLVTALRRALRLGSNTPEGRRANPASRTWQVRPDTKTAMLRCFVRQGVIPRGMKGRVDARCPALLRITRPLPMPRPLADRLPGYLAHVYSVEIGKRGGETQIQGENNAYPLRMIDRADGMALLHVSAWRYYSRGFGSRLASLCYLCGRDDNGRWAVRVPGTCDTVMDALARIEPKEVQSARDNGITVLRQGDVYAVETKRAYDGKGAATLPSNHTWNPETRELRHLDSRSPHATLSIPFPVRFVAQSALRMGRTARRGSAD